MLRVADSVDRVSQPNKAVRNKDTGPEVTIRKALHAREFRYRTNVTSILGIPDIVFARLSAAILVHGCFWYGHDCEMFRLPATRREFWAKKITRDRERDAEVRVAPSDAGWRCLTI